MRCIVLGFFCYCCQQEAGPGPRNEFSKPSENIQLWQEQKLRFSAASLQILLSLESVALSRRNSSSLLTSVWPHVKVQPWRASSPEFTDLQIIVSFLTSVCRAFSWLFFLKLKVWQTTESNLEFLSTWSKWKSPIYATRLNPAYVRSRFDPSVET